MKKNIIKSILFIAIIFVLMIILSFIFIPKDNTKEAGMKEFGAQKILGEKENTVDLIVLGNSEAFTSIIPMKLWEDYGYTSYICGYPGQVLPDTIKTLYDVTRKQKPKVVVLEADAIFDEYPLSVPLARVIQTVLPITEHHDRWKNLKLDDFYKKVEYTTTDIMKGYHYTKQIDPANAEGYMSYSEELQKLNFRSKMLIKLMNEYCKKNGAELIIMSTPSCKNWTYKKHNTIKQVADTEKIVYIDFNLLVDELKIDWSKDTLDKGDHMNFYGSTKLTNHFGKYLDGRKILKNHKNDSEYSKWEKDLTEYKNIIAGD